MIRGRNFVQDYKGRKGSSGSCQGVKCQISSIPARGMAKANIPSENGMFDGTPVKESRCQECLYKVADTLEGDFVRDYWGNLNSGDMIELQVYY